MHSIIFCSLIPTALFSKPQLTVEPTDIVEGDHFILTCSVSILDSSKINNETMQYSIFKDNTEVANTATYSTVAQLSASGNYTCNATSDSLTRTIVKESQKHFVKVKGEFNPTEVLLLSQ